MAYLLLITHFTLHTMLCLTLTLWHGHKWLFVETFLTLLHLFLFQVLSWKKMRWICDTCCPPGGDGVTITPSFPRYEDWILHLLSGDHEEVMRANLMTRVRRTEDNTGFVVTFAKSRVGTLPNRLQLLEYFGTFGCITQFYYDEGARFCFVRVDPMFSGWVALERDFILGLIIEGNLTLFL